MLLAAGASPKAAALELTFSGSLRVCSLFSFGSPLLSLLVSTAGAGDVSSFRSGASSTEFGGSDATGAFSIGVSLFFRLN